jgi:hypothetical protein
MLKKYADWVKFSDILKDETDAREAKAQAEEVPFVWPETRRTQVSGSGVASPSGRPLVWTGDD